jgi:hypothetical protein
MQKKEGSVLGFIWICCLYRCLGPSVAAVGVAAVTAIGISAISFLIYLGIATFARIAFVFARIAFVFARIAFVFARIAVVFATARIAVLFYYILPALSAFSTSSTSST